ncbi:hypothetical protein LNN31_04150 [Acetobacterium wieringae]|uniref:Uncharacterized protein n=1 Tax=Acetobacterium wieringae TaxID=52694 RepID=A0ABY6HJ73_9FIRM|nr:hypothetical protein [Acetobacterium wieringae]UYO63631.1 hypothetical protein LNN31_04150 [Acetobacterium wieringae]
MPTYLMMRAIQSGLSATRSDNESTQSGHGASGSGIRITIPVVTIVGTVGKNGS